MATPDFKAAADIVRRLKDAGHEAYFVGGCVRDFIRGKNPGDYDIATSARPEDVRKIFSRTIPVGENFGIILVVEKDRTYEVATFRTEEGYDDGRRPSRVSFATVQEDVLRRDFTINGLLMNPQTGEIIDYVNGRHDIERQLVSTIGAPERRFAEDRLRMLRAIRFAANLNFQIDSDTFSAISSNAAAIKCISAERISAELTAILVGGGARRGMELLSDSGLLKEILPEVQALRGVLQPPVFHPEGDVWEHTLRMLALLPRPDGKADLRLAWGVLLHDVGKAVTRFEDERGVHFYGHDERGVGAARGMLARLRFSNQDGETILALVREHMMFMNVTKMRMARLKRFLRMPDFDLHLELHRLDCLGSHGMLGYYEFCLQKMQEYPVEELRPAPLLTGKDLITMGFIPGPAFKEMLLAVEEAQLAGEIVDAGEAQEFVRERWGSGKAPG
ncbi:MAG: CCA tRNA nucleotidyltransferase [Syntrophales bacterium]